MAFAPPLHPQPTVVRPYCSTATLRPLCDGSTTQPVLEEEPVTPVKRGLVEVDAVPLTPVDQIKRVRGVHNPWARPDAPLISVDRVSRPTGFGVQRLRLFQY
jgi:hypothetical protein